MNLRRRIPHLVGILLAGGLLLTHAAAQEPAFDVASIRPNTSDARPGFRALPTGRLTATNIPLRQIIRRAFKLHDAQILGAPDWVADERFDIDARTAAAPAGGPDAVFPLLRPLLRDRFMLRTHMETRELPAYVLVVARRDGKLGPQIHPTDTDCAHATTLSQDQIRASVLEGWPPCGMTFGVSYVETRAGGEQTVKMRIRRSGDTMRDFAAALQDGLDRPVIDGTGLEGRFDLEYSHSPTPPTTTTADGAFGAPPPMLFVALEEQLGLKLESRRAAVDVLVIDGIDRPTAN